MPGCCVRDSLQSLLHLSISEADQHLPCPCTLWLGKPIRMCADGGEAWDCLPHTNAHTCILSSVSDTGNCLWHMCLFVLFFKQHAKLMGFIIAFSPSQIFSWSSISLHCALILPALPCPVPFHPHGTLCAFIPPILLPSLFLSASPPPTPIPVPTRHVPVASSPAWPGCAPVVFGHLSVVLETLNYNLKTWSVPFDVTSDPLSVFWVLCFGLWNVLDFLDVWIMLVFIYMCINVPVLTLSSSLIFFFLLCGLTC